MANIKIDYSNLTHFFALALTISELLMFKIVYLKNLGQGHGV